MFAGQLFFFPFESSLNLMLPINPYHATGLFLYPLKTENQ